MQTRIKKQKNASNFFEFIFKLYIYIIQHWGVESIEALLYIIKVTLYPTIMEKYEMKMIYKKHDKTYLNVYFYSWNKKLTR
jgi:hypothetical protein